MSNCPQDVAVEQDILQDCPSLDADTAFEIADLIEHVIDLPENSGKTWTPSELARKIRVGGIIPEAHKVGQVLDYLVRKSYIRCDERGAWSRFYR
jgi:hypothetical protein